MRHNLYDLMVIKQDVIPQKDIEELMELTVQETTPASVVDVDINTDKNVDKNDDKPHEVKKNIRDTSWYNIPPHIMRKLEAAIQGCYQMYVQPKYNCKLTAVTDIQLLGYAPKGHYLLHNDGEQYNNETEKWEKIMDRDISYLFYLNEEFGGGEIEFPQLGLTIKPKKGMMIAFPSYHEFSHQVHPVTWGNRYAIVTWMATEKKIYRTFSNAHF